MSNLKKILLGVMLAAGMNVSLNADEVGVRMKAPTAERPIVRPIRPIRPKRLIRPILRPSLYGIHYHTYVTRTESNCAQYITIIKEKDKKIEALLKENERLRGKERVRLQKDLKEEYDKEMQKFENRRK